MRFLAKEGWRVTLSHLWHTGGAWPGFIKPPPSILPQWPSKETNTSKQTDHSLSKRHLRRQGPALICFLIVKWGKSSKTSSASTLCTFTTPYEPLLSVHCPLCLTSWPKENMAVRAVGINLERSWRDERERQLCPRPPGELVYLRWEAEKTGWCSEMEERCCITRKHCCMVLGTAMILPF